MDPLFLVLPVAVLIADWVNFLICIATCECGNTFWSLLLKILFQMINHYSLFTPINATLEVAFCVFDIKCIVVSEPAKKQECDPVFKESASF